MLNYAEPSRENQLVWWYMVMYGLYGVSDVSVQGQDGAVDLWIQSDLMSISPKAAMSSATDFEELAKRLVTKD